MPACRSIEISADAGRARPVIVSTVTSTRVGVGATAAWPFRGIVGMVGSPSDYRAINYLRHAGNIAHGSKCRRQISLRQKAVYRTRHADGDGTRVGRGRG